MLAIRGEHPRVKSVSIPFPLAVPGLTLTSISVPNKIALSLSLVLPNLSILFGSLLELLPPLDFRPNGDENKRRFRPVRSWASRSRIGSIG